MEKYTNEDLTAYRTFHMPLLQLMALLALAGITLAMLVHWLF